MIYVRPGRQGYEIRDHTYADAMAPDWRMLWSLDPEVRTYASMEAYQRAASLERITWLKGQIAAERAKWVADPAERARLEERYR